MKPLTPDRRSGLAVTGLLLFMLAIALVAAAYKLHGIPQWPLKETEAGWLGGAALAALGGFGCLMMGTDVSTSPRK